MLLSASLRLRQVFVARPVIAFTGAGGKSTLMFQLGRELAASGQHVLLTATTRLWARQIDLAPFALISGDPQVLAQELPISLAGYRQVLALSGPAGEPDKLAGLAPEMICRLAALEDVDAVVVEADGSRERPLKAPAAHEPLVPTCTTHAVTVAGMAALGQPAAEPWVHRPELAAALAGLQPGAPLTAAAMARLLTHPDGGRKGHPPHAQSFLYLNLALGPGATLDEADRRLAAARQVAALALAQPGYQAVLVGSAASASPVQEAHTRAAAIVLAAGQASRFVGAAQPKQLLPWGQDNTLVGHVVDIALSAKTLHEVVVVTGYQAGQVAAALRQRPARCAVNERWQAGQSSSIQAGLAALAPNISAALFLLADQPDVQPSTIDALVQSHRETLAPIVAPLYQGGQRGNPVLFDRSLFDELHTLLGDVGGRALIERHGQAVQFVSIDQPQPHGIETPADYERRQHEQRM